MTKNLILCGLAISIMSACGSYNTAKNTGPDPLVSHIDSTVRPGDNFFMYANGAWFKQNAIPASENSNGIFRTIQDTINAQIRQICERSAASDNKKGSNKQKIGDFYASGMDTSARNTIGLKAIEKELAMIAAIKDIAGLTATMAELQKIGVGNSYAFYVGKDDKNSANYIPSFYQGGLNLPERDYYINNEPRISNIRNKYVAFVAELGKLGGTANNSASIIKIETAMAKASRKLEALRNPYENYNKMSVAEATALTGGSLDIAKQMQIYGLKNVDSVIIGQPEFYKAFGKLLKEVSIEEWKNYLVFCTLNNYADYINSDLEKANFGFYSTVLSGVKEQKPRWKRMVEATDGNLGELIGQVYIKEYLPAGTKEKLLEIGNNIRDVYAEHIKNLDWMSAETKEKSLSKLRKITMKVGYPDKWKDLSSINIDRGQFLGNIKSVNRWEFEQMISKYGKPVDKAEWAMQPQTYNAYYDPTNNEIVVPACNILVPGYEGRMPDDAILYGIIGGSTFGHEITHGFDDQGSQYDEAGNLKDWWTKEDRTKFVAKTKAIVAQYSAYKVLDSINVNGDATQGENIADLGGVVMGLEAFKKTAQFKANELIGGYTPTQRYFLAYGYAWMVNRRPEALVRQVMTDVHSPAEFRINGPVVDIDEFYTAFDIKPTDKMYRKPEDRVKIW